MATRMQQRRGTAAQWISTNSGNGPILAAGEIGFESDTNKFKVGDGVNHWINLDYFVDANSTTNPSFGSSITFEGTTDNAFETTIQVTDPTADRTITFPDATGTVVLSDGSGNVTVSGDLTVSGTTTTINSTTINATTGIVFEGLTGNAFETTLTVEDPTEDRTITFPDATGTVALMETVNTSLGGYVETSDIGAASGVAGLDSSLNLIVPGSSIIIEGATDNAFETTLVVTDPTADRTITFPNVTGTLATTADISDHNLDTTSVHGIADTSVLATTTDIANHNLDTTSVHGIADTTALVTNTSLATSLALKADLASPTFTGTVTLPTGTVTSGMIADGTIVNADVNATAAIAQSKIANLTTDLAAKAPLASPTFTGTVTLPTGTVTSGMIADGTIVDADINASAAIAKTKISGTAITAGDTGTVTSTMIADGTILNGDINASAAIALSKLASGTSGQIIVANASGVPTWVSEAGDVTISDTGVTAISAGVIVDADVNASAAIAQSKIANLTTDLAAKAPLASPTFTGTVTLPTGTVTSGMIADGTIVNADINSAAAIDKTKISGTAITAGDTGTVTSTMIADGTIVNGDINATAAIDWTKLAISSTVSATELGYVDGVTSAIQTQLNAKAPLASPTFTGTVTLPGAPTSDLHAATKLYVDNVTAGINFHESVHAASTVTLAALYNNGTSGVGATLTADTNRAFTTLDGESVVVGQRVLIKNQTDAKQNGIYTLTTLGSASVPWVLTRATDADNNPTGEMKNGDFVLVMNGTTQASIGYINNSATNPIVIGTDNITYTEFSAGKTVVAGAGLAELTPGTLSVASGGVTSDMIADGAIVNADINASAAIAQSKIANLTTDLAAKAPLASPTFTGTVTLPTGTVTSGMILDGTIVDGDINAAAAIAQSKVSGLTTDLAAKAPLAGPTFTGTVTLPSTTSIGNVSATEIGYIDGVTSAIQTQLDAKAPLASPTFTGTVTLPAAGIVFSDGTQSKEGVASRTPIIQKTSSYTLSALTERDSLIEVSSATGVTVSIPTDATLNYPIGTSIDILQTGAGQVTIAAVTPGTTTVNATPGLKLRTQWSSATLFKRAANTWVVMGDLAV